MWGSCDAVWGKCIPFLKRIIAQCPPDYYTIEGIKKRIDARELLLWLIVRNGRLTGCGLTACYEDMGGGKILRLQVLCGDGMRSWFDDGMTALKSYAKKMNAKRFEIIGRPGWMKMLKCTQQPWHVFHVEIGG